jgi:hypothetical protein
VKANRAFKLIVRKGGLVPSRIASANRIDSVEIVDIATAETLFFRDCRARDAAQLARQIRRELAQLDTDAFYERWSGARPPAALG